MRLETKWNKYLNQAEWLSVVSARVSVLLWNRVVVLAQAATRSDTSCRIAGRRFGLKMTAAMTYQTNRLRIGDQLLQDQLLQEQEQSYKSLTKRLRRRGEEEDEREGGRGRRSKEGKEKKKRRRGGEEERRRWNLEA